jgi:ankyrin repeat protein
MSFLSNIFNGDSKPPAKAEPSPLVNEVGAEFRPLHGGFFRTLEYPEVDATGTPTGKCWLEAATDPKTGDWVLWQKSIRMTDDMLTGGKSSVMTSKMLFDKTTFVNCYDQMTTFEQAQQSMGMEPLPNKTPAKLGSEYFRQFAWREGLMMSRSGRLYPMVDEKIAAENFFDAKDIAGRLAFLERERAEQFVPVPIQLPQADWKICYEARKELTDQRLNHLYSRYKGDKDNFDLALQIVGQEVPEVLYAHMQNGFNPKIYETDPPKHFALLKAAVERSGVDSLDVLSDAGLSFQVQGDGQTPLEVALQQHHYSHLHVMLSRDGAQLAKYADASGVSPPVCAMMLQDNQAFRMIHLEGIDYDAVDSSGWTLLHHAVAQNFMRGVYAWLDEGLSIDAPIKGTEFTALSIARHGGSQSMVDFLLKHGAKPDAPEIKDTEVVKKQSSTEAVQAPVPDYDISMLSSAMTNDEIAASAKAFIAKGGNINQTDAKNLSTFELCWKNKKPKPELDRRALMLTLAGLGADPSAQLPDGTTALTRAVSGSALDMDYLKALAPLAIDVNAGDAKGNNILHALQMNNSEQVGLSAQVEAVMKLFPALDINVQNKQGLSNVGLAIRLDRSQTLKLFQAGPPADWTQTTAAGWSYLDLAFTKACAKERIEGSAKAARIVAASEKVRALVLDMLEQVPPDGTLNAVINRRRPDDETLPEAMAAEGAPVEMIGRLRKFDVLKGPAKKPKITIAPP